MLALRGLKKFLEMFVEMLLEKNVFFFPLLKEKLNTGSFSQSDTQVSNSFLNVSENN